MADRGEITRIFGTNCARVLCLAIFLFGAAKAEEEQVYQINLPAQPVAEALNGLSEQTGAPVFFSYDLVKSREANPVVGRYSLLEALGLMLEGTGLTGDLSDKGMLVISLADLNIPNNDNNNGGESMNLIDQREGTKNRTSLLTGVAAFFASLLVVPNVTGQETGAISGGLEEIVVTAQRREQSIQEVPVSVQVLSDEALAKSQIRQISDLDHISASVTFGGPSAGAKSAAFGIRGITTNTSGSQAGQSSVGIILDGVALARTVEFHRDLGDIERVEVLRGPQGTLYGKNATAGVLNIITKGPTAKPDGYIEGTATHDEEFILRGAIGGPLTDRVRGRVYAAWRDQRGVVENIHPDPGTKNLAGWETQDISGKLEVDVTNDITMLLSGDFSNLERRGAQNMFLIANPGFERASYPVMPGEKYRANRGNDITYYNAWGVSANITANLNDSWTLYSITGYRKGDYRAKTDFDFGKCNIEDIGKPCIHEQVAPFGAVSFGADHDRTMSNYDHISQEVRLNYESAETAIIMGAFYDDTYEDHWQNSSSILEDRNGDFIPERLSDQARGPADVTNDSYSIFGDVTRQLTDTFSVFGGLRYMREGMKMNNAGAVFNTLLSVTGPRIYDLTYIRYSGEPIVVPNVVDTPTYLDTRDTTRFPRAYDYTTERNFANLSGRVGLSWQPRDDRNFYLSFARGYKGPSADMEFDTTPATAITDEEIAHSAEVGFKGMFFGKHQLYFSAFWTEVQGLQQSGPFPDEIPSRRALRNMGDMKSIGFETDFIIRITDQLDLTGSLAYTDAQMTSGVFVCYFQQTAAEGCNVVSAAGTPLQSLDGLRVPFAPEWKYQLEGNYNLPLANSPFDAYAQVAWMWQSAQATDGFSRDPLLALKSYGLLDFAVGLSAKSGRYNVEIFGKNALDHWYTKSLSQNSQHGRVTFFALRDQSAYFGIRTRVNFF